MMRRAGMTRKTRTARVRLDGELVGHLHEDGSETEFQYTLQWCARERAEPISLTLPVREEPYRSRGLHPFFLNLLPEGWLLEISTAKLKISKDDAFGLLVATCADCVGRVEVLPGDTTA